ncbi:lamin tail domain-containing protein [Haloarcula marina]|uniref:lamin tail domain-containing protein n=1 Tax=Haloarcula marina TaxID=2961574 RepID=UPI0020B65780|nr:lamin tail domain-containing protein [Halomicroarcula marina]
MRVLAALVVALAVALAGCGGITIAEPTPQRVQSTADEPSAGPLPDPATEASVVAVVDGDTIRVAYPNGSEDTIRLLGVDTPEVHAENDPAEFEGVPDTEAGRECLRAAGGDASNFAKDGLLGETVGVVGDPNADRRDRYDRRLAYVVVDDRLFNYRLVATGHARVYESDFSRLDRFHEAERTAREARRGLWTCLDSSAATRTPGDSPLAVAEIHADAAGNDNENLNDEYVVFENRGDSPLSLAGWTVGDAAGHTYAVGDVTLDPGERVTLYTGSGTDTADSLYWDADGAIWNNGGDTVVVRDADGRVVLERSY